MTTTVSAELAQRDTGPGALIKQYEADFATVLPAHIKPDTFVRLSQGLLRRDPKLAAAARNNPGSFLAALLDCARLGHEPGTDQYALVPFMDKGKQTIVGIEQYQGEIERIYRAGAAASVIAEVVYAKDTFVKVPGEKPIHEAAWFAEDRGDLIGVYAYAIMGDGAISRVVTMGKAEVMKHKAASRGAGSKDSPWVNWQESMWLKTAVHELEKWVPASAEYLRERLRASAEANLVAVPSQAPPLDVLDGDVVDEATGEVTEGNPLEYSQEELHEQKKT